MLVTPARLSVSAVITLTGEGVSAFARLSSDPVTTMVAPSSSGVAVCGDDWARAGAVPIVAMANAEMAAPWRSPANVFLYTNPNGVPPSEIP